MGSARLPGKVLLPLGGTSVLGCVIDRLQACSMVNGIVVATSTLTADEAVASEAARLGAQTYRGSADDVLDRFAGAARAAQAGVIVRITADCPLIDPGLVDEMLEAYASAAADYMSNTMPRTFPRGLDVEIFSASCLERTALLASEPHQREHVTPYIYEHAETFALRGYINPDGTDNSAMRWTLDTPDDYVFLQAVYESAHPKRPRNLATSAVLDVLARHPQLSQLNAHVIQKRLGQ